MINKNLPVRQVNGKIIGGQRNTMGKNVGLIK